MAVDLRFVLSALDGMEGSPFADQMDRWAGGWAGGSIVAGDCAACLKAGARMCMCLYIFNQAAH